MLISPACRVGTNHQHLPVNRPRCPFHHQRRNGAMAGAGADNNGGAAPNCANVLAAGTAPQRFGHGDAGWPLSGAAGRFDARGTEDDDTQAGNLFRLMPPEERQHLCENIAGPLSQVSEGIQARPLARGAR